MRGKKVVPQSLGIIRDFARRFEGNRGIAGRFRCANNGLQSTRRALADLPAAHFPA